VCIRRFRWLLPCPLAATGALLGLLAVSPPLLALPPAASAAPLPYPEAVAQGRKAASAVLARAGAESCLRGKLTRVLLELSSSCERHGVREALCRLADQAVVVTPMSLDFMDQTARQLLNLMGTGEASVPRPTPPAATEATQP